MLLLSHIRMTGVGVAALATLLLAGCQQPLPEEQDEALSQAQEAAQAAAAPTAISAPPVGTCDATQVQGLVGQPFSDDIGSQTMQDANATQLRVLKPGEAATMDFLGERLNIELDEKNVVTDVRCG